MSNFVTYQIALTADNASIIDAINQLVGVTKPTTKTESKAETKTETKTPAKTAKKEVVEDTTSFEDFKKACIAAKKEHGEEFAMQVLEDAGVSVTTKLGTSISKVDAEAYDSIMQDWSDGPKVTEAASDDLEDDGLDDLEDDEAEITAETVTTMLKAYAKDVGRDEAKKIMNDNGAAALSKVAECTPKQLKAMFDALV